MSNCIVKSCILKLFQNASYTRMNLKEAIHLTKLHLYSVFATKYFDSNVPNEAKYLAEKNNSLLHLTPLLEICFFAFTLQLFLMQYQHLSCNIIGQGQARGYGHITSFACCPHGANASNFNNSLTAQYF